MRKFVAGSISTLVAFALVGVGSMSALAGTAAAAPGPTTVKVCAQLAGQANDILTPLANATAANNAAQAAYTAAQAALTTDLTKFVTAIVPIIHDMDGNIDNPNHKKALATAQTKFVTDYLTTAGTRVTAFNTSTALTQLQLSQSAISQLTTALC